MATIVLQVAGAYLGGVLGGFGGAIGSAAGAIAGYMIDRALINGSRRQEGPRLSGAQPFTAEEGASLPRLYGTVRTGGTLIWATRFEEDATTTRRGFKGGPRVTEYSYFANAAFALCEGEIAGIRRVWADGREIDRSLLDLRFYRGDAGQPADPLIEARQGAGNTPAYRGTAYVVIERFPLGDYGNRLPQFQFEVIRTAGKMAEHVRAITLIPGSTEFGLLPGAVTQTVQEGETAALNRHVLHAGSDLAASLDELQMLCPNLKHVALVATWFGNDLRAGECRIRPAVTDTAVEGFSKQWAAAGLTRESAPLVSQHDGGAAYGGAPSDESVIEAITEIKARGLQVTLYPFVMMDVPSGNGLPDPHGGVEQAAYPWRGRVTCHPAPSRDGTADKTAAARAQIDAFCGAVTSADFSMAGGAVTYGGDPDDWGYRRFLLHFAHLAAAAGGVDAILVGSELCGLTRLRDAGNAFPFVETLCGLAAEVRTVLGPSTRITYGADWTEYFGHQPADGSGDVLFHLDPLWAHPAIDAVGIDNYMPLADWRDADAAGGNADGFSGACDGDGLWRSITSGEGYDWYYANSGDRDAGIRTAITDGAYGKPWVFRYKDIAAWWSNPHHDRIGGVEASSPTAWVPQSKPIWLTELGCPAVDKGPNQPNVFPDPKSSESAVPYFSSGTRSDLAQLRFLEAHQKHWDTAYPGFDSVGNPVSSVYSGRMVDPERIYLWAWDARPFPAFPLIRTQWSDGENWSRGHWLNGRLSGLSVADLINAILADHGLPQADVSGVEGTLQGYVVPEPAAARAALDPLAELYGLSVREEGERLIFSSEASRATAAYTLADIIAGGDGPTIGTVRLPDHHLPTEAMLSFRDPFTDYQAATARAVSPRGSGSRQETIGFSGVMETGEAEALLEDWLRRIWSQREQITLAVAPGEVSVAPGALIYVPGKARGAEYLVTEVDAGLVRRIKAKEIVRAAPKAGNRAALPSSLLSPGTLGPPLPLFLDLPMGPGESEPQNQFKAAAWSRPWKSQILFASPEETGFAQRAQLGRPAVIGELVEPIGSGFEGRFDRAAAIVARLVHGELASVSQALVLNGANAAAIRSASGAWEVLQFQIAEEIAASVWRLTMLLRGQLGTGDAMVAGAPAGSRFVLLDEAVRPAGLAPTEAGLALNWRIGPAGQEFSQAFFAQRTEIGGLRARTPLSPVHLTARRAGDDYAFTWIRRSRVGGDDWAPPEIQLGEEVESYRIEIAPAGGGVIRSATTSAQGWLYAAADLAADFAVLPAEADITVRQLSAAVGWGLPATARVTLA